MLEFLCFIVFLLCIDIVRVSRKVDMLENKVKSIKRDDS